MNLGKTILELRRKKSITQLARQYGFIVKHTCSSYDEKTAVEFPRRF